MTQISSFHPNQPITLQQKRILIDVYQDTGNMTLAMRKANIRSPRTAYLWWHRFCEAGEAALQPRSHARNTQKRLSDPIVEQICQLRLQQPLYWLLGTSVQKQETLRSERPGRKWECMASGTEHSSWEKEAMVQYVRALGLVS